MPFQGCPKICPICRQGKKFKFIRDFEKKRDKFSLYQCSECQVQFWLPLKAVGAEWHKEKAFKIKNITDPKVYREYHKKFLEKYKNFPSNTKILDLGCEAGEFIKELENRGWEVWGVDFNKESIDIAKERFGLKRVFALSFDDFFRKENLPKFDIITNFAAFECLNDPLDFIKNIKNLSKSSAIIILGVCCRERMLANLNRWDFPPYLITRWNKEAISNLFLKYGFYISFLDYVEQFKILSEAIMGKFRTGLVNKSLDIAGNKKNSLIIPKIIYFLGRCKDCFITTIPAAVLWTISKMLKRNNGIMFIELKKKP